jgi:uncharacterized heparinase superfamily protein
MPAISPVSAAESVSEGEILPLKIARVKRHAPRTLWPQVAVKLAWGAFAPVLHGLRRSWIYRGTLQGVLPDRFLFTPADPRARKLDEADAILRGRFRLAGQTIELTQGTIFDVAMPSAESAAALHGFDWLRHLEAAGGEVARDFALKLTQHWLKRYGTYALPAWEPTVTAERLFNLYAHGKFFLANSDWVWRAKLFVSMRDQTVVLSRTLDETPPGLPALKAAAGLVVSGFCLGDAKSIVWGLKHLAREIDRQILPDGGHVSRSPEALLEAARMLTAVQQAMDSAGRENDIALRNALDRMGPMLRFFRMGDGALPVFNGGNEGEAGVLAALLECDGDDTRPLGHAANSGFQRLAAGRTLILMDAGCAPPADYAAAAHAGCLSFELSSGSERIVVNCGAPLGRGDAWNRSLRATAAHSTLTFQDTSQATVLSDGLAARLLGPRLMHGPVMVETRRMQNAQGYSIEAAHDGYVSRFGVLHQRRMQLGPRGISLHGGDRLIPVESRAWTRLRQGRSLRDGMPFAVRFHIHPDVRVSPAQARGSVLLKLPGGEGWRFRCAGGALSIEESIYFGGGAARRSEQLVISGVLKDGPGEIAWVFDQINAV